jgi:hypothetical protein
MRIGFQLGRAVNDRWREENMVVRCLPDIGERVRFLHGYGRIVTIIITDRSLGQNGGEKQGRRARDHERKRPVGRTGG